ncbi:unnamed protein product, partial [Anisakis simplex]|uniref:Secreted protein n=1 Tax=Anisakis simplex TaxID=6269 RepID=A0A0M3JM42_ANISI
MPLLGLFLALLPVSLPVGRLIFPKRFLDPDYLKYPKHPHVEAENLGQNRRHWPPNFKIFPKIFPRNEIPVDLPAGYNDR